ncbi:hypothetical protein LOD99_5010 [Oopsacas minuta]|uniref:DNA ligase n=1 Tax=Oopsacas minuta TaxID=111878 RepID=A0AAV7JRZ8_9METZ|nr:hypothetical protein LOD99_5010 [Oopsacas minuta]
MADTKFKAEYALTNRSNCKKCKATINKAEFRIAKLTPSPFSEGELLAQWHHPACLFQTFQRVRATTKIIEEPDDVDGYGNLENEDKKSLLKLIESIEDRIKVRKTQLAKSPGDNSTVTTPKKSPTKLPYTTPTKQTGSSPCSSRDNTDTLGFEEFTDLCIKLESNSSHIAKKNLIQEYLSALPKEHTIQAVQMLLPAHGKDKSRIYHLKSRQLMKLFSGIFSSDFDKMNEMTEQNGDVSETICSFFLTSSSVSPADSASLSLTEIDKCLEEMSQDGTEKHQSKVIRGILSDLTAVELKYFVRLIKKDLKTAAGVKPVMDALSNDAYAAFQASQDIEDVVTRVLKAKANSTPGKMKKELSIRTNVMVPIKPMLAEACKSYAHAFKRCPNGFYSELKYDGERVQVHKQGDEFKFYARSLKPVAGHKVNEFTEYLPKACPADSIILDCEVLLMDLKTSKPLPFGTLGVHKKSKFQDATCCLFIFDIMYLNGTSLVEKSLKERRKILHKVVTEIPNRIQLSQGKLIVKGEKHKLEEMMSNVMKQGLEGLVMKGVEGVYEPGKRHWLKMKKDYLSDGAMADSADLVVLGAYYGTGVKGGLMSVFLMGVHDTVNNNWCTVAKAGNGLDDNEIQKLQTKFDMIKIGKDMSKVPSWLSCTKTVVPDFVVKDPKNSQVWEIVGAEFSESSTHTADGISIRFPRIAKVRDDKGWRDATDLQRLKKLYQISKEHTDIGILFSPDEQSDTEIEIPKVGSKRKSPATKTTSPKVKRVKEEETNSFDIVDPLPDIFSGIKLYISGKLPVDVRNNLERYIIAFGGVVLEEFHKTEADYTIQPGEDLSETASKTNLVTEDWVWDRIKSSAN